MNGGIKLTFKKKQGGNARNYHHISQSSIWDCGPCNIDRKKRLILAYTMEFSVMNG